MEPALNLTDKQKDLLQLLVSNHETNGGLGFMFILSNDGGNLTYPGWVLAPVACEESDLLRLKREDLIDFDLLSRSVYRGQLTQLGIRTVRGFSAGQSVQQSEPAQQAPYSTSVHARDPASRLVETSKGRNGETTRPSARRMMDEYETHCPLLSFRALELLKQRGNQRESQLRQQIEFAETHPGNSAKAKGEVTRDGEGELSETDILTDTTAVRREIIETAECVAREGVREFADALLLSQGRLGVHAVLLRNYTAHLATQIRERLSTSQVFLTASLLPWQQDSIVQAAIRTCEEMLSARWEIERGSARGREEVDGRLAVENGTEQRTWSPIVQDWEALKSIRKVIIEDHERIPESDLRNILAGQYAVKLEDVTSEHIERAAVELCRHYDRFQIIPSASDLFAAAEKSQDLAAVPDSGFWKAREDEFRKHDTAQNTMLGATWFSESDRWAFHANSGFEKLSSESLELFKSLAREASKGHGSKRAAESWIDWMELLCRANDEETDELLYASVSHGSSRRSEREVERMIRAGQSIPAGGLIEFAAMEDGTIQRLIYWDNTTTTIANLFRNSANFCLKLRSLAPDAELYAAEGTAARAIGRASQKMPVSRTQLTNPKEDAATSAPAAQRWENIEITFLSDERVEILIDRHRETHNYSELGFNDRRTGKPNEQWAVLQLLARNDGTLPDEARTGKQWEAISKRIERTRKTLQKHFRIIDDPVPHFEGIGYRARFRIRRSAGADT